MATRHGIWIDREKAVIVTVENENVTSTTVKSDVAPHTHYAGAQDGGGEQKYEERHAQQLKRFFDDVAGRLGTPEAVLIFGPGETKHGLRERLERSTAKGGLTLESADRMTDAQIVAKVRKHYELERRAS